MRESASVRRLCEAIGVSDAQEAVLLRTKKLLHSCGVVQAPYPLHTLAEIQRVKSIVTRNLSVHGLLESVEGGFVIHLNKRLSPQRRRFTLGHEIAHTFFRELENNPRAVSSRSAKIQYDRDEERLCDVAATEMLLPRAEFQQAAFRYGPSCRTVLHLANSFGSSVQATAIRLCEAGVWRLALGLWVLGPQGWCQRWTTSSRGCRVWAKEWQAAPGGLISKSFEIGYACGWEAMNDGTDGFVEAIRVGNSVLSLLLFERHPEYLVNQFKNVMWYDRKDMVWGTARLDYCG